MLEKIEIKYVTDDMYYKNKMIKDSHIVYSDISNTSVKDRAKLHSLKFCLSGIEIYKINGYEKHLKPGEFILVNPEQDFQIIADKENTQGICLFFKSSDIIVLDDIIFENRKYNLSDNPILEKGIFTIKEKLVNKRQENSYINFNSLYESIFYDNKLMKHSLTGLEMKNNNLSSDLAHRLIRVKEFIDNNYYENLDIDQLAYISYTSKYHFLRMYKKMFGITPYNYILEKKLLESKELLKTYNTVEVARKLNFSDRSAFSNRFKRRFKENPMEYKVKVK